MSPSSWCYQCKQPAGIKCLHCSQNFCRIHFREHEETISDDIHPLTDRLNNITEQSLRMDEHKKLFSDELNQWQEASHRIIDDYCQVKRHEIEEKIEEYKKEFHEKFQLVKDQIKPFISHEFNVITHEQIKTFEYKLNELEKVLKQCVPSLQLNPLQIDSKLISFINKTSSTSLLDLKMPRRTCQIKFDASPMVSNGKFILLQDATHTLGLYDCDSLSLHRQIAWPSTDLFNIIDLHWSYRLEQFLILTREHLYTLNTDCIRSTVLLKTGNDFRAVTSDDNNDDLFLATSTSIDEYSLSTFDFSKRYNMNEQNIYSLRFNSNTNQFGLTIRTYQEHKWYFEVRNRSMIRLWSILTPIERGSCVVSILFNYNEWIIVNIRGDILFQVTNDGQMKADIIYGGRNLLNAIENKKLLVIRTYGYLEQYEVKKRPYVSSKGLLNLKSIITQNASSNNNFERLSSIPVQQNDQSYEIEEKRRKNSQLYPNQNVLIEYLTKSNINRLSKQSNRRIINTSEQSNIDNITEKLQSPSKRIVIAQTSSCEEKHIDNERILDTDQKEINKNRVFLQSNPRTIIFNHLNGQLPTSMDLNNQESMIIPRFPSSSCNSSNNTKPLLSFLFQSTNSIHDETRTNKPIPNSKIEFSTNRKMIPDLNDSSQTASTINNTQFECVRSPVHKPQYSLPSDLLDCCETYQQQSISIANHLDNSKFSVRIRDTMINISKRLTNVKSLPLVDTHCHFDLIFDRLSIKYNDLKKYFDDYKEFYPSNFSFELAIQVFWRSKHLTEKNWINWYSKYLDDERVYGSCGIHPHWSSTWEETSIQDIERCLKHPKVVAIGEIGFDFGPKNKCNIEEQSRVFEEQLKLAVKWSKPIVIHSRNAYQQTFDIMKQHLEPDHKIHLHCFVGTMDDVRLFTSYFTEIKFGFTPIITRSHSLHSVIQQLDLTQILSETDSPYFIPEELSNLTNCGHPSMVYSVVETIAQIRYLSVSDVAYQLRENARHVYSV